VVRSYRYNHRSLKGRENKSCAEVAFSAIRSPLFDDVLIEYGFEFKGSCDLLSKTKHVDQNFSGAGAGACSSDLRILAEFSV